MKTISLDSRQSLSAIGVKLFTLIALILFSLNGISQSNQNLDLANVESQIQSFRAKIEHVKSSPSENTEAINSGWYNDMRTALNKLFDQKRNIIFTQTGKKWLSKEEFEEVPEKKKQIIINDSNFIIEQN